MDRRLKAAGYALRWVLVLALATPLAAAQPSAVPPSAVQTGSSDVGVEFPDCDRPPFEATELLERLALELDQRGIRIAPPNAAQAAALRLRLDLSQCEPDAEVLLFQVEKRSTWQVQQGALALSDLPARLRPRILGLVLAESVSALATSPDPSESVSSEPTPPPPAPAPPVREAAPPPVVASAVAATPGVRIGAAAQLRSTLREPRAFWGAELELLGPESSSPSWALEVAYAGNSAALPLGALHVQLWSAAAGVDWTHPGLVELSAGPRVAVTMVSSVADPRPGVTGVNPSATIASFGGRARISLPLGAGWSLAGALDLQHPFRGLVLTAGNQRAVVLDAWTLAPSLGVAYQM